MLLGSLTVGLMGFARTPLDLTILRFAQGASSGVTAAGTTLVATGTPRSQVGWALGISGSAVAIGAAAGPVVGGLGGHVDAEGLNPVVHSIILTHPWSEESPSSPGPAEASARPSPCIWLRH